MAGLNPGINFFCNVKLHPQVRQADDLCMGNDCSSSCLAAYRQQFGFFHEKQNQAEEVMK